MPRIHAFSVTLCETMLPSIPSSKRPMDEVEELSSVRVILTDGELEATPISVVLPCNRPVVPPDLLEPSFDTTLYLVYGLYWAMDF